MEDSDSKISELMKENQQLKNSLKENEELLKKATDLKKTVKTLRRNFQGMVQLLTETIALDNLFLGSHLKRCAEMAKAFCEFLKLPKDIIYLNYYAALLHDIGLVGASSSVIENKYDKLNHEDKIIFDKHPILGFNIINSIYNLKRTAIIIRSHHENYDGTGFPDKLTGGEIPKESRVIHIINDYDINKFKYSLPTDEACSKIDSGSGILYDPELVNKFLSFISHFEEKKKGTSRSLNYEDLKPGMYLNQDVILSNGLLLIPSGVILDKIMIGKIQSFNTILLGHGQVQITG
jgi:response regulator RpfG family c-di-GMP phosphodiesterase